MIPKVQYNEVTIKETLKLNAAKPLKTSVIV